MKAALPWGELVESIAPYVPKGRQGQPPFALQTMLRIHFFMQRWFKLSDPAMEEILHDMPLFRECAKLGWDQRPPNESTILWFRHLPERHLLADQILVAVNEVPRGKGLIRKAGTVVDATLISAPSSTRDNTGQPEPEMHRTEKGNQWCQRSCHLTSRVHRFVGYRASL
jgi:IS5 family transposase